MIRPRPFRDIYTTAYFTKAAHGRLPSFEMGDLTAAAPPT